MSRLSDLNYRLSTLNARKSNIISELNMYDHRRRDVESLINKLIDVTDGHYGDVNKYANKIVDQISSAIIGSICVSVIQSDVSGGKEKGSGSDAKIVQALNDLRAELSRIRQKVNSLNSELNSVRSRISSTHGDIAAENRRIAEERARRLAEEAAKALGQ